MKNMHSQHASISPVLGIGSLGASGLVAFMTSNFAWVVWAILALVVADVLLNISDEATQFQTLVRALVAALVPYGLQWLGHNDGHSGLFFRVGLTIALGVLLTSVGPQIIRFIGTLFAASKTEKAAAEAAAQATIAKLMADNQALQAQISKQTGTTIP